MSRPSLPQEAEAQRKERYERFYAWRASADATFRALATKDSSATQADYFNNVYTLVVVPMPDDLDSTAHQGMVRVFYGLRAHRDPRQPQALTLLGERGAALSYQLLMNGAVLVMLTSAVIDREEPIEEGLVLDIRLDGASPEPESIERDWKNFHRYMRVTSLDGAPTFCDQMHVAFLRLFCRRIVDKRVQTRRILTGLAWLGQWSATVGLSGLLLWCIQTWTTTDKVGPAIGQMDKHFQESEKESHQDQLALQQTLNVIHQQLTLLTAPLPSAPRPNELAVVHRHRNKSNAQQAQSK